MSEEQPPSQFNPNDLRISSEMEINRRRKTADIRNNEFVHWAGLIIVCLVTIVCLGGLFFFHDQTWQSDTVSKLLFTIVGGVMGFVYGSKRDP